VVKKLNEYHNLVQHSGRKFLNFVTKNNILKKTSLENSFERLRSKISFSTPSPTPPMTLPKKFSGSVFFSPAKFSEIRIFFPKPKSLKNLVDYDTLGEQERCKWFDSRCSASSIAKFKAFREPGCWSEARGEVSRLAWRRSPVRWGTSL